MADSVKWGKGRLAQFIAFIDWELRFGLQSRLSLERQWREWLEMYRAPAKQPVKKFPYEGAPLSRDTEILTRGGWKRIDRIRTAELVLTRRDTDGVMEWAPVQALPQRYAEKLYHFKSRSIDLQVTEEHTMICESQRDGSLRRMPASKLWGRTGYYLPQHGVWQGVQPTHLFGCDPGDVAELVGWYLAEGCRLSAGIFIAQSLIANSEKYHRIETLLNRLCWNYSRQENGFYVKSVSIPVALRDMLWGCGDAHTKRVPELFFDLSPSLIDRLLSAMVAGDGNVFEIEGASYPKVNYYTISRGLADDVQVLVLLCGLHARVRSRVRVGAGGVVEDGRQIQAQHRCYEVTICGSPRAKYDRSFREVVDYNDVAFCVTVKNHAIYARRRGTACWTGNSNIVLPIAATDIDQLYAKEMQTLHAPANLWTLEPLNERWVDAAHPMQDALTWLDRHLLKMQLVNERVNLEKYKLGTGIYKTSWAFEKRNVWTYNEQGEVIRAQKVRGQPLVDHVKCADFVLPPYSYAIQPDDQGGAPWVAERLRINVDRLRSLAFAAEPFAPNWDPDAVNFILKFVESNQPLHDIKIQDLDYLKLGETRQLDFDKSAEESTKNLAGRYARRFDVELWEVHARFPTGGQGFSIDPSRPAQKDVDSQDDIVVWYHLPTRRVVRAIYNPYRHGKRPYEKVVMFPGEGFWGIGICEQKETFQTLGSELMNFTVDNVLLGNSQMLVAKAGANIVPGEPIYPGKIWIVDGDVRQDFSAMAMAPPRSDLGALGAQVQALGERRTGISDIQLGNMQELPGRTPATTMLSLLQEGNRRPDLTIKMMREGLSNVGLRIVQLLQQYTGSPVDVGGKRLLGLMVQALGMPEGMFAAQKLATPFEDAALGLGVSLTATSGSANKEVEKQNYVALLQLAGQLTPQFIQLIQAAQQAQGTPVGQVALQSALGLQELYRRLLEQYDVKNIADVAPDIKADTQALQSGNGQGPPGPSGAPGAPAGAPGGALGAGAVVPGLAAPSSGAPELESVLGALGVGR